MNTRALRLGVLLLAVIGLTLALGQGGLAARAPALPTETLTLRPAADTHISSQEPDTNFGDHHYLELWYQQLRISQHGAFILLRFDLQEALGPEAVIDSATLELYQIEGQGAEEVTVTLHPILEAWDETTVTWTNQPEIYPGPFVLARTLAGGSGWRRLDVTALAQGWHGGARWGVELRGPLTTPFNRIFESVEHNERMPQLVVTYHVPTPTPTASFTPSPSPTIPASPTPSPTPSPTRSPTASPTPRPADTPVPPAAPPPDLIITDLWPEDGRICAGAMNIGRGPTGAAATLRLALDGATWDNLRLPAGLPADGRWSGCFGRAWACAGAEDALAATVDAENTVVEADESNNGRAERWTCDRTAPTFTEGPLLSDVQSSTAVISWRTDEAATARVDFGPDAGAFGRVLTDPAARTGHSLRLEGLAPATTYRARVTATDGAGNAAQSATILFQTAPAADSIRPSVTLDDPGPGRGLLTLSAQAADNVALSRVLFFVNDQRLLTDYSPPFTATLDTRSLADGMHQISARAVDRRGNEAVDTRPLAVANPQNGPQVTLSAPAANATVKGTVAVKASVSGDAPLREAFLLVDGQAAGWADLAGQTSAQLSLSWDSQRAAAGRRRLAVLAVDEEGRSGHATVDVVVDNSPPPRPFFTITTHQATRLGNRLALVLTVHNTGAAAAQGLLLNDFMDGWLPQSFDSGSARGYPLWHAPGYSQQISVPGSIAAGEKRIFVFTAVPLLTYPDQPVVAIGERITLAYEDSAGTSYRQDAPAPIVSSTGGESLAGEYALALRAADYLIVSNPARLVQNFFLGAFDVLDGMGRLAVARNGAVGLAITDDPYILDALISPPGSHFPFSYVIGQNWGGLLHPRYRQPGGGYVLLVGETEVVPSFSPKTWSPWKTFYEVMRDTDHNFGNTGGSGAPELIVGRAIGDTVANLLAPLEASIAVADGQPGHKFVFQDAFLVSGPPAGSFVSDIDRLGTILGPRLKNLTTLHANDYFYADSFWPANAAGGVLNVAAQDGLLVADVMNRHYDEIILLHSGVAYLYDRLDDLRWQVAVPGFQNADVDTAVAGDIGGNAKAEIIVRLGATPGLIRAYDTTGQVGAAYAPTESPGALLAVGDISGDAREELLVADDATDTLFVGRGLPPAFTAGFQRDFDAQDRLLAANFVGDAKAEIIHLDWDASALFVLDAAGAELYRHDFGLAELNGVDVNWTTYLGQDTDMAAAKIYAAGAEQIILAPGRFYQRVFVFGYNADEDKIAEFAPLAFTYGPANRLAAGQVHQEPPGVPRWQFGEIVISRPGGELLVLDGGNYSFRLQNDLAAGFKDSDLVMWSGHGNVGSWGGVLQPATPLGYPVDFGPHHPVVVALSCLTGNYQAGGAEWLNVAEALLDNGAAVYIGATEPSAGYANREAGALLAADWQKGESIGVAFNRLERGVWDTDPNGRSDMGHDWRYWVMQYNLYGDPKFGAPLSDTLLDAAMTPAGLAAPPARLDVALPAYELIRDAFGPGLDDLRLPGGELWLEPGALRLPYSTAVVPLPAGVTVAEVRLSALGGAREEADVALTITPADAPACTCEPRAAPGTTEGFWPQERFEWQVVQEADGTRALRIRLFPFSYNAPLAELRSWSSFRFDISYGRAELAISGLSAPERELALGAPLALQIGLEGTEETAVYALELTVTAAGARIPARGYPLRMLSGLSGAGTLDVPLDLSGLAPGAYSVSAALYDPAGRPQGAHTLDFSIGAPGMVIESLSATPWPVTPGGAATLRLRARNTGELPLTGTLLLDVRDGAGGLAAAFSQPFTGLKPGETVTIVRELPAGLPDAAAYALVGTAEFAGRSAQQTLALSAAAAPRLYLPVAARP